MQHVETNTLTRDELEYRLDQQAILGEFGSFALQSRDLKAVLQRATELCAKGLQTRYSKVLEYIPEENGLLMVAGVGWKDDVVGSVVFAADMASPAGFAYHTGEPILSNHLENEDRFRTPELLAVHGIRRAINVLIKHGGGPEAFGVLEVDSSEEGDFDKADTAFLAGFAALLGIAIERQRADKKLAETLEDQALLTREMSHRVKNSLSVVSSLLRIQARGATSDEVRKALDDAGLRVSTVAQVHDHIWRSSRVGFVDLGDFLRELCRNVEAGGPGNRVLCKVPDDLVLMSDRAIPLGLFVNETVTNAIKYAYPEDTHGPVRVTASVNADKLVVEVSDDGIGMPTGFDLNETRKSLGLTIISNLARQLNATLHIDPNAQPGAHFRLEMPLE